MRYDKYQTLRRWQHRNRKDKAKDEMNIGPSIVLKVFNDKHCQRQDSGHVSGLSKELFLRVLQRGQQHNMGLEISLSPKCGIKSNGRAITEI